MSTDPVYCACGCGTEIVRLTGGRPRRFAPHHHPRAEPRRKVFFTYILHFDPPYKSARHYTGMTRKTPEERLATHCRGYGGRLVHVAVTAGSKVTIARAWRHKTIAEAYAHERVLKLAGAARMCPTCKRQGYKPRCRTAAYNAPYLEKYLAKRAAERAAAFASDEKT